MEDTDDKWLEEYRRKRKQLRESSDYKDRKENPRQAREKSDYKEVEETLSQLMQNKDQININDLEEIYRGKGGVTDCDFGNILGEKLAERRANKAFWELADQLEEIAKAREKRPYREEVWKQVSAEEADSDFWDVPDEKLEERRVNGEFPEVVSQLEEMAKAREKTPYREEVWKQASAEEQAYIGLLILEHKEDVGSRDEIEEEINYLYDINNYIEIWKQAIKNKDKKNLVVLYDIFWAVEYWKMKGRKLKQLEGSQLNIVEVKKNLKDDELNKIESAVGNTRKKYRALIKAIGLDPKDLKMLDGGVAKYFTPRGTETLIFSILLNTTPDSLKKLLGLKSLNRNKLRENVEVIRDIIDTMDKVGVAEEKGINYQDIIKAELNYKTCEYIKENHNNFIKEIEAIIKDIISLETGKNIDLIGPRVMEFYYEYLIGEAKNYVDVLKNIELGIRGVIKPFEKDVISRIYGDQAEEIKENEYLDLIEAIMRDRYSKEVRVEGRLEYKLCEYIKNGRF